jgi:CubicO group peptidase (beta-lactamase class C family)
LHWQIGRFRVANDPPRLIPGRTRFYLDAEGGGFENAPTYDPSHKLPGAGFLATAEDLARFGAALLRAGVVSDRGRAELFRPVPLAMAPRRSSRPASA